MGVIVLGLKSCEPGTPEGGMREEGVRQAGEIENPATNGAEKTEKEKERKLRSDRQKARCRSFSA